MGKFKLGRKVGYFQGAKRLWREGEGMKIIKSTCELIIIGKKYKNIHNGVICTVTRKIFWAIQHINEGMENYAPSYTHYKKFRKHWKLVEKCINII